MAKLDRIFSYHIERLRTAGLDKFSIHSVPEWIVKHTKLGGRPFSFKDHEYQLKIAQDTSTEVVIRKCSQVGISELSSRMALALTNILQYYTVIYTLPTAAFAATFMRTRIDPVIDNSIVLREAVHQTTDNSSVKRFGSSYIYVSGSQSNNAPISIPADHLFHDELDFSDDTVISQYHSRLSHSAFKRKTKLSTPTIPDYGIDLEFAHSRRHWNFVICEHCGHYFIPNYYEHVKIPGFFDDLRSINKKNLHETRYQEAFLQCPSCKKATSLQQDHREWVCENPEANFVSAGYQVQPFDAPNIITLPQLIYASTTYKKRTDFDNFSLGMPAEDVESTLTAEDFKKMFLPAAPFGFPTHVMGIDMGLICHIMIAGVGPTGEIVVVHAEQIPLAKFQERRAELCVQYRVTMTVMDSLPYTETVLRLQERDPNLFGAVYSNNAKSIEPFRIRKQDEETEAGLEEVRQVTINRNKAFDILFLDIRDGLFSIQDCPERLLIEQHMRDMKRVKKLTQEGDFIYTWVKSNRGDDHFHHAALYVWIAARIKGVSQNLILLPPVAGKFKVKEGIAAPPR